MTIKTSDKYNLRERAILVRVSTSMFGTQKKDKDATNATATQYGAAADQVAVTKSIINRKNPLFKKIDRIKGLIRNTHLAQTGVWDDNFRIIATKKYSTWRSVMDELIINFDNAVDDFIKSLPDIIAEAKDNLGSLYDASLIPSAEEVREAFNVAMETEVLPDRGNVVMDLDKAQVDGIVAAANAADQKRLKTLGEETHAAVRKELETMVEALRAFGNDLPDTKRTRTFRDSLVKRMAKLADTLPGLNVTGDPKLDKLAQDIAAKLTVINAAELRGDKVTGDNRPVERIEAEAATKREETANAAAEILNDLDGVFGNAA
jgi:hypothetical protein